MKQSEIYIEEEHTYFFWGLFSVVCVGGATYLLANAFLAYHGNIAGYRQILGLLLLAAGAYGIIKISRPLFHFILSVDEAILRIEIRQEDDRLLQVRQLELDDIEVLRISPHTPRTAREALFDFSTDYHLVYRLRFSGEFEPLLSLKDQSFTLKVQDIRKIMRFLADHNPTITIPEDQALFIQ